VALDPKNAEYHELLGVYLMLQLQNAPAAIPYYQQAAALNPHVARYWLNLEGAYEVANAKDGQERALERAVEVDPTTPEVAWEAANFYVVRGEREAALREFKTVLQTDEYTSATLELCWRATHDVDAIEKILPSIPDKRLSFMQFLLAQNEPAGAETVWSHLVALKQPFDSRLGLFYVNYWLSKHDVQRAQQAWKELTSLDRLLQPYLPSPDNLIVNSSFEEDILNSGFDWQYSPTSGISMSLDSTEFHGGNRSLLLEFDGGAIADAGLQQLIPVEPNASYDFSAYTKTEEIQSANGPHFAINDAYTGAPFLLTDELFGTSVWRRMQVSFKTGPDTRLAALKIVRIPGQTRIKGKLWIDDLSLVQK
jgi:tetratricopeptide (TPR) repeat protein